MTDSETFVRRVGRRLPASVKATIKHAIDPGMYSQDARFSLSQEGEDILLERLFGAQTDGFFVDVGAHHPTRFSNTAALYRRGWRGINIDATPGSMAAFRRHRPHDINLEIAITSVPGEQTMTIFDEAALNTLDTDRATDIRTTTSYAETGKVRVRTETLATVLAKHLPDDTAIDLMSIDVEGLDFDVIQSNNWDRFRPRVLIIEVLDSSLRDSLDRPEVGYLEARGYVPQSKLFNSVLLTDEDRPHSE